MLDDLPIDMLYFSFKYLNITDLVEISKINKKYNFLICDKYIFLLRIILDNYGIEFLENKESVTFKKKTKALTIPNSLLNINISKKLDSFLKII